MIEPKLLRRRPFLLPVASWRLVTPLPIEDASLRFDAAVRRMERRIFGKPRRIVGGVCFGVIRYSIVLREPGVLLVGSDEPHNPGLYDGQMLMRGRIVEIEGGCRLHVILLPGLFMTLFLLATTVFSIYLLITTHEPFPLFFAGPLWAIITAHLLWMEREAFRYLTHAFQVD